MLGCVCGREAISFEENRHPPGIVGMSKGKEPGAQIFSSSKGKWPISNSLSSDAVADDEEVISDSYTQ